MQVIFTCFCTHRNGTKEKWYKFNDTIVEEFDMNEDTLEAECFGGTYKATVYDTGEVIHKHTVIHDIHRLYLYSNLYHARDNAANQDTGKALYIRRYYTCHLYFFFFA